MKTIFFVMVLSLSACDLDPNMRPARKNSLLVETPKKWMTWEHRGYIDRFHDDELGVTCWGRTEYSCIPDSSLRNR